MVCCLQQFFIKNDLNSFHLSTPFHSIVHSLVGCESFPMQDEPEGRPRFQREMSLKGGVVQAVDC
jgi:hypothetical protein